MSEHEGPHDVSRERVRVVPLSGEVDLANATYVRERVLAQSSNDLIVMVVDLTDVSFIDSSGVRVLFDVAALLQERDQRLFVVVSREADPWRTLQLSGIERVARVFEDLESARAAAVTEA